MMRGVPLIGLVGWPQKANFLLAAAWRERGFAAELLPPSQALARLRPGDVAVTRLDVLPSLDGVQRGLDAIDELAERGVRVVNTSAAVLGAHDKLRTAMLLGHAGVPIPRTVHIVDPTVRPELSPPLVVKPRFGSWGADVLRCQSHAELAELLDEVSSRPWFVKHGALVQELLPPVGHDLRLVRPGIERGRASPRQPRSSRSRGSSSALTAGTTRSAPTAHVRRSA